MNLLVRYRLRFHAWARVSYIKSRHAIGYMLFFSPATLFGCADPIIEPPEPEVKVQRSFLNYSITQNDTMVDRFELTPIENSILTDGTEAKFRLFFDIQGKIESANTWQIEAAFQGRQPSVTTFSTVGEDGYIRISGSLLWSIPVSGPYSRVTVNLIHASNPSTTFSERRISTVVSISRRYVVICNPHEFFLIRIIKDLFEVCIDVGGMSN